MRMCISSLVFSIKYNFNLYRHFAAWIGISGAASFPGSPEHKMYSSLSYSGVGEPGNEVISWYIV